MTKSEIERLVVVEQQQRDNGNTMKRVEQKLDHVIERLDNLPSNYVTRQELSASKWLIGLIISVAAILLSFLHFFKDR